MTADGVAVLGDLPQAAIERAAVSWLSDRGTFECVNWGTIRKLALAEIEPRKPLPAPDDDERPFAPVVVPEEELERRRLMAERVRREFPMLRKMDTDGA